MNKKYPLTPEGVERKQSQLFELPDDELQEVSIEISKDLRSWVFNNFELTEEQSEYYKNIPEGFNLFLGWQNASSIISRSYVKFEEVPTNYSAVQRKKKNTKYTVSGSVSYSESSGWGGTIGGSISF